MQRYWIQHGKMAVRDDRGKWVLADVAEAEIKRLRAEIKRLQAMVKRAGEHPLVMEGGGTDNIDRCHRVINRLSSQLKEQNDPERADFYWDDRCLEHCVPNISDAVDGDDVGDVVTLRPVRELPNIRVRVVEDGYELVPMP